MKKLKLSLSNMEGVEVLTRAQLKKVMGGSGGGGRCVAVYSSNGQQSCYYSTTSAEDLCNRVYGDNCLGIRDNVDCNTYSCTMN